MAKTVDLTADRNIWIGLVLCLSVIAFFLLWREGHKQFGSIAYGVFPEFTAVDAQGQPYNQHALKNNLSAVVMDEKTPTEVIDYLRRFATVTAQGRRYLKVLVFYKPQGAIDDKFVRFLGVSSVDQEALKKWHQRFQSGVILVDQDKVVRGVFNVDDKLERLKFEAAVGAIL